MLNLLSSSSADNFKAMVFAVIFIAFNFICHCIALQLKKNVFQLMCICKYHFWATKTLVVQFIMINMCETFVLNFIFYSKVRWGVKSVTDLLMHIQNSFIYTCILLGTKKKFLFCSKSIIFKFCLICIQVMEDFLKDLSRSNYVNKC